MAECGRPGAFDCPGGGGSAAPWDVSGDRRDAGPCGANRIWPPWCVAESQECHRRRPATACPSEAEPFGLPFCATSSSQRERHQGDRRTL